MSLFGVAEPAPLRVTVTATLADVLELNRTSREQRLKGWLAAGFGILQLVLAACFLLAGDRWELARGLVIPGVLFLLIGLAAPTLAGLGTWFFRHPRRPFTLEFVPSGVFVEDQGNRDHLEWGVVERWYQTTNLIVLVIPGDAIAVPKRCCSAEDLMVLVRIIEQGVGAGKKRNDASSGLP